MDYLFAPEEYKTDRFILQSFMPGDGALFADARNTSFDHPSHQQFMRWEEAELTEEACEKMVRIRRAKYLMSEDFSSLIKKEPVIKFYHWLFCFITYDYLWEHPIKICFRKRIK